MQHNRSIFMLIISLYLSTHLTISANGETVVPRRVLGDIAINCGCFSNSTALDGRHWVGEETPFFQPQGKSTTAASAATLLTTADPTPFFTARISSTHFSYTFQLNPGQKFLRLHFCPAPFRGFTNSRDFFTVKANSFRLMKNFSASFAADAFGVKYFVKEFCLNINETGILQLIFSASESSSNTFVFVNGIEIISMPTGLYYTPDDHLGVPVIGESNHFYKIDNNTALELIQRLNVGGGSILSVEDTGGMFRRWHDDSDYLFESSAFQKIKHTMPAPEYIISTPFPAAAPIKIYQTSRILHKDSQWISEDKHRLTWKIPVDLGFCYLLRLHFGSVIGDIMEGRILIQNVVVESQLVNVIQLSGGNGIAAVYRDYMVMMRGDKTEGKRDLFISLESVDESVFRLLKGIEIFKLSNIDNSLASPNLSRPKRNSSYWSVHIHDILVAFGHLNVIMTTLTVLLAIVNAAVYRLRQICEFELMQVDKRVQLDSGEPSCRHFSLAEILSATRNFDDALVVGRGGFGKVYKGLVYGCPQVLAIKRLKPDSNQGAREFWTEIEMLSKLRHIHLVPLIGYCNESGEMILVYEYMPRGTVADNIYKNDKNEMKVSLLTWEQRLRICIGAARGLDYLHTGTQSGVIHRDVKATNILLDENYLAKISDFGLSKQGSRDNIHSTKVWGSIGYLDPHYIATRRPSITSDVYAFGVVLLVVLSGRPAVETKFFSENVSLLARFHECMEKGEMKDIIDPSMQGEISVECLTKFIEAVVNCVHHVPKKRPTMAQVVVFLEHALEKHRASALNEDGVSSHSCKDGSNQQFEFRELQGDQINDEKVASLPVEGSTSKEIQNVDLSIIPQKPFWARRLFDIKKMRKTTKKKDHPDSRTANSFVLKDVNSALVPFDFNEVPHVAPIIEETAASFLVEGNTDKDTQEADLLTKVEVLQPRETVDGHIIQESWFSIKSINMPVLLSEHIRSATRNFSDEFKIEKRRLYDVYKVFTTSGSGTFEIIRFHDTVEAYHVFNTHLDIRKMVEHHVNLFTLLGYCGEIDEMILVYQYLPAYMTLDKFLSTKWNCRYDFLSWEQRLRLCRGIARGLHHLHETRFIHRDLTICDIMLDENMVPKISTFGCVPFKPSGRIRDTFSLMGADRSSSHGVGTPGYLDPYYAVDTTVSQESNVYSFGVIMLVVLSGKPAFDHSLPDDQQLLTLMFTECFTLGNLEKITDPNLKGGIPSASLNEFVDLINNCLRFNPKSRPKMDRVVANLKRALHLAHQVPAT